MESLNYDYGACLETAKRVNWTVESVIAARDLDFSKHFMPEQIAGVQDISCLTEEEKLKLNQIRGYSYVYLFHFVETFIIPQFMEGAKGHQFGDRTALSTMVHFTEEELKHQELFMKIKGMFEGGFGTTCELIPNENEVGEFIMTKSSFCVWLFILVLEWLTQRHYLECFKGNQEIDPVYVDVFRNHWVEEAQHAKTTALEILEASKKYSAEEKDTSVTELIELIGAVDGLLQQQVQLDLGNLARAIERDLTEEEKEEIQKKQIASYRWTFIFSGATHPKFQEVFQKITTPEQQQKVTDALGSLA